MGTKIQIGGMPFEIEKVETEIEVCHDGSGQKSWGQISYSKHSIRVLKACPERELRSTLHEVLHGIINEYRVRELMDDKGEHMESPIDQLALGLAEVLESIGITELKPNVKLTGGAPGGNNEERRVGRQPDEDSQKRGPFDDIFAGCRLTQEQFDEHERVCEERARKEREDASNAPR